MIDIEVKDFTVNGKCSNCGQCCSNCLPLSEAEIKKIKAYVKQHKIKEQRHNVAVGVDMTCPFRDEANRKCLIYEIRPAICREFVCNHTQINRVVFMRAEFFGNREDVDFFASVMKYVVGGCNG